MFFFSSPYSIVKNRLVIATHNRGKLSEITALLDGLHFEVTSLTELAPTLNAPEEVHDTFADNALLKARFCYEATGCLTLADDSGLEVDELEGRPGVHSARYAGSNASSAEMIAKLLGELEGVPCEKRKGRFVCVVALVGNGIEEVFRGTCEGQITIEPRGSGGFGYDPVFLVPETGKTFGEMTLVEKAGYSHRGRALAELREYLTRLSPLE